MSPRTRDLLVAIAALVVVIGIQGARLGSIGSVSSLSEIVQQLGQLFTDRDILITAGILAGTLFFLEDTEAPDPL